MTGPQCAPRDPRSRTRRSSASTSPQVDPDHFLGAALSAVSAGSVAAVGDLFDLVGADVWRAAVVVTEDTDLAQEAVVRTFRDAWRRPDDVPRTVADARRWFLDIACEVSQELAAAAPWARSEDRGARR